MQKTNRLICTVVGLFFILHCCFTILYSFPQLIKNSYLEKATRLYMYPLFNQNWKIFAPEPPVFSKKIKYRVYLKSKGWSFWIDPGEELLKKHHKYRFTYHRKEYGVYEYLFRQLEQLPEINYQSRKEYKNAVKYIESVALKRLSVKNISLIQFELVYEKVPTNSGLDFTFRIFEPYSINNDD